MASALYVGSVGDDDGALAAEVGAANRAFYRAFADGDFDAMQAVWSHGAHVRCVHPGWTVLEGWERVRESWARILAGPDGDLEISIEDVQVRAGDDVAWVACTERLSNGAFDTVLIATNVFERDGDGPWLLVQHHASPILRDGSGEPDRQAPDPQRGGGGNDAN
jgi:ketosteroid isomerase-like protein